MMIQLIQFSALFLLMLVAGVFWGPWFALHRSLHVFTKEEFIHIVKTLAANLAVPMRILMPACIMLVGISVIVYPANSLGFGLSLAALIFIVISLLITIVVEVPIVNQIVQWTLHTIPSDWEEIRNRWVKFHVLRTLASLLAFISFISSIIFF